ncbi:MAG: hypothetical protein OHK0040_12290 [bacterium]
MSRLLSLLCLFFVLASCAAKTKESYDRNIKNFKFERAVKKVSIGVLYFADGRSELEKLGVENIGQKSSLRNSVTKLAEEMLLRSGIFSSVSIITSFDLPDFYDEKSLERFRKSFEIDYILGGEIVEAKIVKVEKKTSLKYKTDVFLSSGTLPESYDYVAKVKLRGKLVSVKDGRILWEGEGKSSFIQGGLFVKRDNVFIAAIHNSLGQMLSNMSKVFSLSVKEVE